ncbi:MAG TPA: aminoglycoside phosphotransferase family protein [Thermoanaerobaculia bacterium]|nr:aminoglycoside phosphotransferase family protein [Thermoanaerobaculia bacterium]
MNLGSSVVDAIFSRHGVPGPWEPLPSLGLANRIFATHDVVLRVATDHPDGVADARTESVAAPVARAAGILTPRLIAFDDTRTLVDRPFSLWERVHGETLGLAKLTRRQRADVWRGVGSELAKLHLRVRECADPHGFLEQPARAQDLGGILKRLLDAGRVDRDRAGRIELMAEELLSRVTEVIETRFIHDDVHAMNVMCSSTGELLAIIDWGDAGWGDPALDFAAMPSDALPSALQGYEAEAPGLLGRDPRARIAWNRLLDALDDLWETPRPLDLTAFDRFMREGQLRAG